MLGDSIKRLKETVNGVYSPRELESVTSGSKPRRHTHHHHRHRKQPHIGQRGDLVTRSKTALSLALSKSSADLPGDDESVGSGGDSSLSSISDGEADNVFDTRRRAKDLDDIMGEGRKRLLNLERRLKTTQRVEAIKDLADWFEHRAPEVTREIEELNKLERRHGDDQVEAITSAAATATKALEQDMKHQLTQVEKFRHHLHDEVHHVHKMEEEREQMKNQYEKLYEDNDDEVHLNEALDELHELQKKYQELDDPLHGLDAADHTQQEKIDGLKEAIGTKQTRIEDLQRVVDESGYMLTQMQEILSAIKLENRGGLSVLEPALQHMAGKLKDKAMKGAESFIDTDKSVMEARAKAEAEDSRTAALDKQAKELEAEVKSRVGIMRIVEMEELASARSRAGSEVDPIEEVEEQSARVKADLMDVMQQLREQKSELVRVQADAFQSRQKLETLETARAEVRENFRRALDSLRHENQESLLKAAKEGRQAPVTPSEWKQHLESAWSAAEHDPELFARCLWLDPISDGDDSVVMGAPLESRAGPTRALDGVAGAEGGEQPVEGDAEAQREEMHRREEHQRVLAELQSGEQLLWGQLGFLEDTLCVRRPVENEEDMESSAALSQARQDGAEVCLQKLRDALAAEDLFQRGALQELADESLSDAASLQWLTQRLKTMVAPAAPARSPSSRRLLAAESPRGARPQRKM